MRTGMLLVAVVSLSLQSSDLRTVEELLKAESEDLTAVPPTPDGKPLELRMGFYIESLGTFRTSEMDYDMDMYLRQSWVDPRLEHRGGDLNIMSKENAKSIWYPDIYFTNVTMPNFSVHVNPDGTVAYSTRVILKLACNLNLRQYPLDEQECKVKIMSYALPESEMVIKWFDNTPITYNPDINLPEFYLDGDIQATYCNGNFQFAVTKNTFKQANFSCLQATMKLERNLGYHMVQTYIPTGLIVVISWVSFWIDSSAVPARISLSFTTLLTLATQGTGLRYSIPAVSYAKAIDFWFGTCMIFVFAALIEFAVVNSLMRKSMKLADLATSAQGDNNNWRHASPTEAHSPEKAGSKEKARTALRVDITCRYLFPSLFLFFNLIYWTYYTNF